MPQSRLHTIGSLVASLVVAIIVLVALMQLPWWLPLIGLLLLAVWMMVTRVGRQAWSVTQVGIGSSDCAFRFQPVATFRWGRAHDAVMTKFVVRLIKGVKRFISTQNVPCTLQGFRGFYDFSVPYYSSSSGVDRSD